MERPRRGRRIALVAVLLLVGLVALLWSQRKPIASDFIDDALAARGVPARYQITRLGFRSQRLERISIGDPARPDLTADWAEIDLAIRLGTPEVRAIRAHGVRLRGRLDDGVVRMGAVDKLLPPPSGKPFTLPAIRVALDDARMQLDTDAGPVALRLDGSGKLSDGFNGRLRVAADPRVGGCAATGLRAVLAVRIDARRPHVAGPVTAEALRCSAVTLGWPRLAIDVRFGEGLNRWSGQARLAAGEGFAPGLRFRTAGGRIGLSGSAADTGGALTLAMSDARAGSLPARRLGFDGRYRLTRRPPDRLAGEAPSAPALRYAIDGIVSAQGARPPADMLARAPSTLASTPLGPVAAALASALDRNARSVDARADIVVAGGASGGSLRADTVAVDGAAGAQLRLAGGEGVRLAWPGPGRWQVDGRVMLAGGGLPAARVDLSQPGFGAPLQGVARVAPYQAGGARLALDPVRFARTGSVTRFATVATLDGPIANGRVTGLTLPLAGEVGRRLTINPACAPVEFRTLTLAGLALRPARFRLCPVGGAVMSVVDGRLAGGGRIVAPRLEGLLGSAPIALAADSAEIGFARGGFIVSNLEARLGPRDRISRLAVARIDGRSAETGLSGQFAGLSGAIANVPLRVSESAGRWRLAAGVLTLRGGARVADAALPPRFNPLRTTDLSLVIAGDRLTAAGMLVEPTRGIDVMRVALIHSLSRGVGQASLDVPGIAFGKAFQPELLTPLTLGVVANVEGTVRGSGEIRWSPDGVSSSGTFATSDTALAAAFGPVTGLSGTIRFTDLLGLVTPPGQTLRIGTINPGIAVEDGELRYQLVPGQRIAIEGGRWPFAGGTLTLRPTTLAFGATSDRRLTFDVAGLDAAKFINKLEFDNLSATGTFDGTLPMLFDADGGRIVDGTLAARAPGGTLAYVGEVSNANLGIWGGIAFDALKAIAYQNLTIGFNGAIDGEMVSQVRFDGVSRGTVRPVATGLLATIGGRLASKLQALPFRFNIRIQAPFRGLIATSRSFSDPSLLVRDSLPPGLAADPQPVQPPDSEDKR